MCIRLRTRRFAQEITKKTHKSIYTTRLPRQEARTAKTDRGRVEGAGQGVACAGNSALGGGHQLDLPQFDNSNLIGIKIYFHFIFSRYIKTKEGENIISNEYSTMYTSRLELRDNR